MKRKLTFIMFIFVCIPFYGQPEVNLIEEVVVGKNLLYGTEIKGLKYEFDNIIVDLEVDSVSGLVVLTLQPDARKYSNPRYGLVFDLKSDKIVWTKQLLNNRYNLEKYDSLLFLGTNDSIYRIEIESGDSSWAVSKNILAIFPKSNIMLSFNYDEYLNIDKKLEAISLIDGSTVWVREIDLNYGVNDIINLNDSTILIVAAGLHKIDLRTGVGWDYTAKTGSKDYLKFLGTNLGGVAISFLSGVYFTSRYSGVITGLASNLVWQNDCIYFASKNKLACISDSGKEIWSTRLSSETGNSVLILKDNSLVLINTGIGILKDRPYNYGESYFSAYDKNTGELKYIQKFNLKNNPILEQKLFGDTLNLIFNNYAAGYSFKNGEILNENRYELSDNDRLNLILKGEKLYVKIDSLFKSLYSLDKNSVCVLSENGKVYTIDKNLKLDLTQNIGKLYIKKMQIGNYTLIADNRNIDVISEESEKIAQLNIGKTLYKYGSKLIAIKDNSIIVIDFEKVFE